MNLKTIHFSKSFFSRPDQRVTASPADQEPTRVRASMPGSEQTDNGRLVQTRSILIFNFWIRVASPHGCDPSGRGRCYCGRRELRVVGVIKPKSFESLRFRPYRYALVSAGFGILHPFFVPSSPVTSTFRFRLSLLYATENIAVSAASGFILPSAPSTAGRELYPRLGGKQGVCEDFLSGRLAVVRRLGNEAAKAASCFLPRLTDPLPAEPPL